MYAHIWQTAIYICIEVPPSNTASFGHPWKSYLTSHFSIGINTSHGQCTSNNESKIQARVWRSRLPRDLASFDDDDVIVLGMPWKKVTRYLSFQHCVFHREIRGARGLWLSSHLSHAGPPPSPSLSPCLSLSLSPSSSACLSHFDSSLGSASARSPFPLPPTVVSSSISILSQCHFILPLVHSVCAPVSPSLLSVSPPLSPDAIFWTHRNQGQERNASVWASSSLHVAWGFSHVCAKEDQKDQLRSAAAASEKSISIWPC